MTNFSTCSGWVEEGWVTCLIPCPPVIFPGVFQPCAALKPWMGQCGSWEQMGHPYPEGLSSNFFYAATSPFPNIDAYHQHQALASSMACLLLDASHGVLKSTLSSCSPTSCFTLGLWLEIHLAAGQRCRAGWASYTNTHALCLAHNFAKILA